MFCKLGDTLTEDPDPVMFQIKFMPYFIYNTHNIVHVSHNLIKFFML